MLTYSKWHKDANMSWFTFGVKDCYLNDYIQAHICWWEHSHGCCKHPVALCINELVNKGGRLSQWDQFTDVSWDNVWASGPDHLQRRTKYFCRLLVKTKIKLGGFQGCKQACSDQNQRRLWDWTQLQQKKRTFFLKQMCGDKIWGLMSLVLSPRVSMVMVGQLLSAFFLYINSSTGESAQIHVFIFLFAVFC